MPFQGNGNLDGKHNFQFLGVPNLLLIEAPFRYAQSGSERTSFSGSNVQGYMNLYRCSTNKRSIRGPKNRKNSIAMYFVRTSKNDD